MGASAGNDLAESERICAVSREALPVSALLRFVADPDGRIMPDIRRRLPGRGVNLRADAVTVTLAIRRKTFERGLKRPVTVPESLVEDVRRLLTADLVQALAMANKAGMVITGFGKVESALEGRKVAALIQAREAAPDGVRKLRQAALRGFGERAQNLPVIDCLPSASFQLAFGRDIVIHAAILPGPAVGALLDRWRRLVRFDSPQAPFGTPGTENSGDSQDFGARGDAPEGGVTDDQATDHHVTHTHVDDNMDTTRISILNDKPAGHIAE
jgi:predicted RNA-binding protein YlxR (DUF448 family)